MLDEVLDTNVLAVPHGQRRPEQREPHEQITHNLVAPEQRLVDDVTEKHRHENDDQDHAEQTDQQQVGNGQSRA